MNVSELTIRLDGELKFLKYDILPFLWYMEHIIWFSISCCLLHMNHILLRLHWFYFEKHCEMSRAILLDDISRIFFGVPIILYIIWPISYGRSIWYGSWNRIHGLRIMACDIKLIYFESKFSIFENLEHMDERLHGIFFLQQMLDILYRKLSKASIDDQFPRSNHYNGNPQSLTSSSQMKYLATGFRLTSGRYFSNCESVSFTILWNDFIPDIIWTSFDCLSSA